MSDDYRVLIERGRVAAEYTRTLPELSEVFAALTDALEASIARARELERTIEQMCEQIQGLPGSRETVTAYMLAAAVHPKISDGLKDGEP